MRAVILPKQLMPSMCMLLGNMHARPYEPYPNLQILRFPVSIHNLRTVAPRYGELLALLVYLTWLLHWFLSSNPTSFRAFLG
jgi:hypothetical protein